MGGYKYINKIADEYTKWTTVYLTTINNLAPRSHKLFVG